MIQKLITGSRRLDRTSQREMVNYLSPFLFPICRRYAHTYEDAKDLLQEALILIFNNIDQLDSNEELPFKSWCRRIAINNALAKIRKNSSQLEVVQEHNITPMAPPKVYSQLNVEEILRLLQFLPSIHRAVFNLSVMDGYTHKEIADLLNIKESSSRTFLVRARQSLQRLINQQENRAINTPGTNTGS